MRFWTLEDASAALDEVRALVQRLRRLTAAAARARGDGAPSGNGHAPRSAGDAELRDALHELTSRGIVVRDPARGLIDFPARSPTGREYLLCWLDGEDAIEWWHWPDAGFAGRTPLSEPPT
ncbi:MAG TPA: DUF2203 domain-containing protein [Acidimicrobiia bacterium]|nr:DUF2203 domain-containing protein [Acidimicrobiia bacterium]